MDIKLVEKLLDEQDGNFTKLGKLISDRIKDYPYYEVPFPNEFLCFEERYLLIKKHMIDNGIKNDVVDIGCQLGFQSEIFLDGNYLGIDCSKPTRFFNEEKENVNYIVGTFPYVDVDLSSKTVISSMSLGYFNSYISDSDAVAQMEIVNKLVEARNVYIATKRILFDDLASHFKKAVVLDECDHGDFSMYFLSKD